MLVLASLLGQAITISHLAHEKVLTNIVLSKFGTYINDCTKEDQ